MITIFTVRSGCDDCLKVFEELKRASYSYIAAEDTLKVPTFISVVYHSKATRPVFEANNFKTVPYLACSEMQVKRDDGDFYKLEDIWRIKKDSAFETQQLLDFINKRFNNQVQLKQKFSTVLMQNSFLFVVLAVLIRVFISIQNYLIN